VKAEDNSVETGEPRNTSLPTHHYIAPPDISVDEVEHPEAHAATLPLVQLLQGAVAEQGRPWTAVIRLCIYDHPSPMRKKESTLGRAFIIAANAPFFMNSVGSWICHK
jgi:hypothetical protein